MNKSYLSTNKLAQAVAWATESIRFNNKTTFLLATMAALSSMPASVTLAAEAQLEEIMVTGSRIRTRDGMETPTPVTSLSMDELLQLDPGNLIDSISQMPQFMNNASPETAGSVSGPLGAANVNLRGIGSKRTLVLLDGRRVPSFNRLGTVDINTFPEPMIRDIEIVTGGASAAYGSGAVSGTVNFFLDTGYSGLKTHLQKGITDRGDGETTEFSLSGGADLGSNTHFIASADMYKMDSVSGYNDRSWFDNWGTLVVDGVPTIARDVHSRENTAGGLILLPGSALDGIHFIEGGTPLQFEDGSVIGRNNQVGGTNFLDSYGSAREVEGELAPEVDRTSAFFYLDHDFTDTFTGYFQYMYGNNKVNINVDSGIMYGRLGGATIYRDNAYLPDSIAAVMDAEGLESFPLNRKASSADLSRTSRVQDNELNSFTLGFKSEWNGVYIQGYAQHAVSDSVYTAKNYTRTDRMYRALDTVLDSETGAIVCRSTLSNPNDGCVPANYFGAGTMSEEAIAYILGTMWRNSEVKQDFAELSLDTELFEAWAGPISVAGGVSYRKDSLLQFAGPDFMVAQNTDSAESQGYKGLPSRFIGENILQFAIGGEDGIIQGEFDVVEVFAEALIPLVRDVAGVEALDFSVGVRQADYSGSGTVLAYKGGMDWRINDNFRVRLTRSRDTRAASLSERFDSQGAGGSVDDPFNDGINYTISRNIGGNPDVAPELSDTWTAGFVYTPTAFEGFSLSVDYYDVKISDAIAQFGDQNIVDDCFESGKTSALCDQIEFDNSVNPGEENPRIVRVSNVFLNLDEARVTGYDIEAAYSTPVDWFFDGGENLNLRLFASILEENSQTPKGSVTRDNAGEELYPELSVTAMLNYSIDAFSTGLTFRYIDERTLENDPSATVDFADPSVDSIFITNLRFAYDFETGSTGSGQLFFNITNLFNEDPPIIPSYSGFFGTQYVNPGLHDVLGRRYTVGVKFEI